MPTPLQVALLAVAATFAAGVGYCEFRGTGETARVREFCADITPGTSIAALRTKASAQGYAWRPDPGDSGFTFLADERTLGRDGCRVMYSDGIVTASAYRRPE